MTIALHVTASFVVSTRSAGAVLSIGAGRARGPGAALVAAMRAHVPASRLALAAR